jgi:hypothetical protein
MRGRAGARTVRHMLRALPLLAAVFLLLIAAAGPPEAAAKPRKPAACKQGQIKVGKACVPRRAIRVKPAAATPRKRVEQGAKLAPKPRPRARAVRRLRRKVAALSDRIAVRAGIARAGEIEIRPDGEIAPVDLGNGATGGGRVRIQETAEGQVGAGYSMDVEATQRGAAGALTMGQTYDRGAEVDGCPDAGGVVRGDARFVMGQHQRARLANGTSGSSSWRMTAEADIEAQVEPDARISTYRRRLVLDVEFRANEDGRHIPTRRYRAVLEHSGIDPRVARDWKKDPPTLADLEGSYRGPRGQRFTVEEGEMLIGFVLLGQVFLEREVNEQLLKAERGWYDDFACATLEVDPAARQMAKNESAPFAVRFRANDGALADASVQASAWGGSVGPATGATPFSAAFTLAEERGGVELIGTSRRGRAKGHFSAEHKPASGWKVTLTGSGYYARDEESPASASSSHAEADFNWTVGFGQVALNGETTTEQIALGGTFVEEGVIHSTGSYRCEGTPAARHHVNAAQPPVATLRAEPQANGDVRIVAAPFAVLIAAPGELCVREGYSGGYGTIRRVFTGAVYDAVATVTAAQLSQPSFAVPVGRRSGVSFPGTSCFFSLCVESGDWSGQLRFERG